VIIGGLQHAVTSLIKGLDDDIQVLLSSNVHLIEHTCVTSHLPKQRHHSNNNPNSASSLSSSSTDDSSVKNPDNPNNPNIGAKPHGVHVTFNNNNVDIKERKVNVDSTLTARACVVTIPLGIYMNSLFSLSFIIHT